jgi:hypothetical protein
MIKRPPTLLKPNKCDIETEWVAKQREKDMQEVKNIFIEKHHILKIREPYRLRKLFF